MDSAKAVSLLIGNKVATVWLRQLRAGFAPDWD
jgi:hypothetical protein